MASLLLTWDNGPKPGRHAVVRVVVGWNGSAHSRAAVMWSARVAEQTGRDLVIVQVTPPGTRRLRWHSGMSPLSRTLARAERELRRDLTRRHPRLRVTVLHEVGDPARTLVTIARTSLLVIGSTGPAGVTNRSLGPVVTRVVATARGPLVVVPGLYAESRDELPLVVGEGGPVAAALVAQFADEEVAYAVRRTSRERAARGSRATWLVVASCPHDPVGVGDGDPQDQGGPDANPYRRVIGARGDAHGIREGGSRPARLLAHLPACHCRDLDLLRSAACPVLIVPEQVRQRTTPADQTVPAEVRGREVVGALR